MTDLEFINHPLLATKNRTLAYFKQGLLPMSYDWPTVHDESFYMNIVEKVIVEPEPKYYISFLKGLYAHSRYKKPLRYELTNGNWQLAGNMNWYWPHSIASFDPMI